MFKKIISFFTKSKSESVDYDEVQKEKISAKIWEILNEPPNDLKYYLKAFTHRSFLEVSNGEIKSNERLEFLGDSILGKITAEFLFHTFPTKKEGFLTKARAQIVNKTSLEKIATNLGLQNLLFLNKNYLTTNKMKMGNILADSLEALIAAIYIDKGDTVVKEFVLDYVVKPQIATGNIYKDKNYKGQLLELAHSLKISPPLYKVIEQSGPQHNKVYKIKVELGDYYAGEGMGPNKKSAEQEAAKHALKMIESDPENSQTE